MARKSGSGAGTKKFGRDSKKCQRYRAEGRRAKNKDRKVRKEEKRQARFALYKEKKVQKTDTPI